MRISNCRYNAQMLTRALSSLFGLRQPSNGIEAAMNRDLRGYPRNHNYSIRNGSIFPGRRLRQRWNALSRHYPRPLGRFLDIGSCKGFFVLRAVESADCELAVGIDVHQPFIDVSRQAASHLRQSKARFQFLGLEEASRDPARFGGPFHTVQLVSTYHYLYWGSDLEARSYCNHAVILEMIRRLCEPMGKVIFANPLEVSDSPAIIRAKAASVRHDYTEGAFQEAATKFFSVQQVGFMDSHRKRPLLILTAK